MLKKTEAIPYAEFKLLRFIHPLLMQHYRFKQPLPIVVEKVGDSRLAGEDDFITCALPKLYIYGCGDTIDAALQEFEHILVTVYESYSNTPKEELTQEAQNFLLELDELLERVK
ncbi:hypothetical protein HYR99_40530 [Candidatus Poribacteria bacterium]|nr:hypothetical protein [Candidatus Poribacteria bacterium]